MPQRPAGALLRPGVSLGAQSAKTYTFFHLMVQPTAFVVAGVAGLPASTCVIAVST